MTAIPFSANVVKDILINGACENDIRQRAAQCLITLRLPLNGKPVCNGNEALRIVKFFIY